MTAKLSRLLACAALAAFTFSAAPAALVLSAGEASAQSCDQYQRWINVENHTNVNIYTVQSTNRDRRDWGNDLLGQNVIAPGRFIQVNPEDCSGYCRFDFLVTWENGASTQARNVNLCEATRLICTSNGCSAQ